jgi:hypothetical protein
VKPLRDLGELLRPIREPGDASRRYGRRLNALARLVRPVDAPAKPGGAIDRAVSVLDDLEQRIAADARFTTGERKYHGERVKDVKEHVSSLKWAMIDSRRAARKARHALDDLASLLNRYGLA